MKVLPLLKNYESFRLSLIRLNLRLLHKLAQYISVHDPSLPKYQKATCAGLDLLLDHTVSHPAPLPGLSFASLFEQSAQHIGQQARVLEMGAGAGVWSLLCAQRGARVTANDLPEVNLSGLKESAQRLGITIETTYGDLFEALAGRTFDHIFFNPPFHHSPARNLAEKAYFGGQENNVVIRFLQKAPSYLTADGIVWLILPKHEEKIYKEALTQWRVCKVQSKYLPLLGSVQLFALVPKNNRSIPLPLTRPMNPVSECFYQLSKAINTHSCELLTIQGPIQINALEEALNQCLKRNLLTRSLLCSKADDKSKLWSGSLHWVSQHPTPKAQLYVEELSKDEELDISSRLNNLQQWKIGLPQTILKRIWFRSALDPHLSPPFEFRLLKGQTLNFFMVLSPHLSTDAFAGTHLVNQIAEQYQNILIQTPILKQTNHPHDHKADRALLNSPYASDHIQTQAPNPLGRRSLKLALWVTLLGYFKAFRNILFDMLSPGEGLTPSYISSHTSNQQTSQRGQSKVLIKRIRQPDLKAVLQGARKRKVKAHTLFSWGLAQAIQVYSNSKPNAQLKGQQLRFADLCTLRPLIDENFQDDIDVLVQPYTHTINLKWNEDEALANISKYLDQQKNGGIYIDLLRSKIYSTISRYLPLNKVMNFTFKRLFKTNITTTNPGPAPLNFSHFGEAQVLDFINFPQIAPPADLGIIYTTFKGELRIITLYDENRWNPQDLQELLDLLWSQVLRLAQVDQESVKT